MPIPGTGQIQARGCRNNSFPAGHARTRIVTGEARHGAINQRRICGRTRRGAEPETFHRAVCEILDDDIGGCDQAFSHMAISRLMKVEDNAALAALEDSVRVVPPERAAGRIDTDHIRACIGQQHGCQRTRQVLSEIDDADALECAAHPAAMPSRRAVHGARA